MEVLRHGAKCCHVATRVHTPPPPVVTTPEVGPKFKLAVFQTLRFARTPRHHPVSISREWQKKFSTNHVSKLHWIGKILAQRPSLPSWQLQKIACTVSNIHSESLTHDVGLPGRAPTPADACSSTSLGSKRKRARMHLVPRWTPKEEKFV